MELRCPDCVSPEVDAAEGRFHCNNCGARFDRDQALVSVLDAETPAVDPNAPDLFLMDRDKAHGHVREESVSLWTSGPWCSNPDEIEDLVAGAQRAGIIVPQLEGARIHIYPICLNTDGAGFDPVLAVDPGNGPTILGPAMEWAQDSEESSASFTFRVLTKVVQGANALAAGRAADSQRLDRILARINVPGEVQGADFLEFVERELRASGRSID